MKRCLCHKEIWDARKGKYFLKEDLEEVIAPGLVEVNMTSKAVVVHPKQAVVAVVGPMRR